MKKLRTCNKFREAAQTVKANYAEIFSYLIKYYHRLGLDADLCAKRSLSIALLSAWINKVANDAKFKLLRWQANELLYMLLDPRNIQVSEYKQYNRDQMSSSSLLAALQSELKSVLNLVKLTLRNHEDLKHLTQVFEWINNEQEYPVTANSDQNTPENILSTRHINITQKSSKDLLPLIKKLNPKQDTTTLWQSQRLRILNSQFGNTMKLRHATNYDQILNFCDYIKSAPQVFNFNQIINQLEPLLGTKRSQAIVSLLEYLQCRAQQHINSHISTSFFTLGSMRKSGQLHMSLANKLVERLLFDRKNSITDILADVMPEESILLLHGGSSGRLGKCIQQIAARGNEELPRKSSLDLNTGYSNLTKLLTGYFTMNSDASFACEYYANYGKQVDIKKRPLTHKSSEIVIEPVRPGFFSRFRKPITKSVPETSQWEAPFLNEFKSMSWVKS